MKIPSSFKLLGQSITVSIDPNLSNKRDCTGEAHYRTNQILLQDSSGYDGRAADKIEHDFCHELVHFLLYYGSGAINHELKEPAHKNEELVDLLAGLLHQSLTTMEYKEAP